MTYNEALSTVIDLARSGALDDDQVFDDKTLAPERDRQLAAIAFVELAAAVPALPRTKPLHLTREETSGYFTALRELRAWHTTRNEIDAVAEIDRLLVLQQPS